MTSKTKINQFKWLAATIMLVAAMVMPATAWAEGYDENGFGSESDPYQPATLTTDRYDIDGDGKNDEVYEIGNAGQLYWFAELVNRSLSSDEGNESACAELTADIEVSGTWTPIMGYNGTFDGNGHTISGLRNVEANYCLGLFGMAQNSSVIRNVGIVNCVFSGTREPVGGVCGENYGTIENCYTTGSITIGGGGNGGGVCGNNHGTIKNCYNTGTVDGLPGDVGGVCGINEGTIENCYNTGSVSKGRINGGVCGGNTVNGTITNCYYLSGTAIGGIDRDDAVVPSSAEAKITDDFASGEVAWLLNGKRSEGTTGNPLAWYQNIKGDSYPVLDSRHGTVYRGYKCLELTYSNNPEGLSENPVHHYDNGFCEDCNVYQPAILTTDKYDINGDDTNDNVYEIGNAGQLYWFADKVNNDNTNFGSANAVLTANITVNSKLLKNLNDDGTAKEGYEVRNWMPISPGVNYSGTFDGNGNTISGLYYNVTSDDQTVRAGLFGRNAGTIKNVSVKGSYFKLDFGGKSCFFGILCGFNAGTIENCYNESAITLTGTVGLEANLGGICGANGLNGIIKNCNNVGKVSSEASPTNHINVGGVSGINSSGTIENSSNTGEVSGTDNVGGVCGYNLSSSSGTATITSCYNEGKVSGTYNVGGVCGYNQGKSSVIAEITNCYNKGTVSGTNSVGGVCGDNHWYATITECYNEGKVSGTDYVGGVCGYNDGEDGVAGLIIKNSYNKGVVSGTDYVGGVCGYNYAYNSVGEAITTIENCYNTNTVSGTNNVGGVCGGNVIGNGNDQAIITNCYYDSDIYTGSAVGRDNGTVSNTEGKTTKQFASGEVCYLLNNGMTDGSQVWYQTLSGEGYPDLNKDAENRTVYAGYRHSGTTPYCSNTQNNIPSSYGHLHAYNSDASDEANGNHDMSYKQNEQNPYTWTDIDNDSNATAKCNFICSVCQSEVAKDMTVTHNEGKPNEPAKCIENGHNYYVASLTFNGTTYTEYYTQEVPDLGHDDSGDVTFNSEKSIYEKYCNRDGCDMLLGYYATSDGSVEAIEDPKGDGFTAYELTLQDATKYDNQAVFTATNFIYTRKFSNTNWTTWYVPFDLTLTSDICAHYDFSRINNVHQYDTDNNGTADKTVVESFRQMPGVTLKANYPYLVKPVSEGDMNMVLPLEGVKPALAETNRIDCQSVDFSYTFTGTYTAMGEGGSGYYDPYTLWTDGTWQHFQSLAPMRHYLTVTQRNSSFASVVSLRSIMLSVIGDEGTTGIVNMYSDERKTAETYDLGGRRLPAGASQRGVVIENGKVIIKK